MAPLALRLSAVQAAQPLALQPAAEGLPLEPQTAEVAQPSEVPEVSARPLELRTAAAERPSVERAAAAQPWEAPAVEEVQPSARRGAAAGRPSAERVEVQPSEVPAAEVRPRAVQPWEARL